MFSKELSWEKFFDNDKNAKYAQFALMIIGLIILFVASYFLANIKNKSDVTAIIAIILPAFGGFLFGPLSEVFKDVLIIKGSKTLLEQRLLNYIKKHNWLLKYGLTKVHSKTYPNRTHYYYTLKVISAGIESLLINKNSDTIIVSLFFPKSIRGIKELLENDSAKEDLKKLYDFWNEKAKNSNTNIIRNFVCDEESWQEDINNLSSWYEDEFPDIHCYHLNNNNEETLQIMKVLGEDLDFAIIESPSGKICIGFISGKITYVLLGGDELGPRVSLLDRHRNLNDGQLKINKDWPYLENKVGKVELKE